MIPVLLSFYIFEHQLCITALQENLNDPHASSEIEGQTATDTANPEDFFKQSEVQDLFAQALNTSTVEPHVPDDQYLPDI